MLENIELISLPRIDLDLLVSTARLNLKSQGENVPTKDVVRSAIVSVLNSKLDAFSEGLSEKFEPDGDLYHELLTALDQPFLRESKLIAAAVEKAAQASLFEESPSIFNGMRIYSVEKYEAMIEYIAFAGKNIFQTNLNKLLFYSDFGFYYLQGSSISGAAYKPLPYGPVNDGYRNLLDSMERRRKLRTIHIKVKGKPARILRAKKTYNPKKTVLNSKEIVMLDWVLDRLGNLSSEAISDLSHLEKAWKNTGRGGPISYEFAELLRILPPHDLLS